MRYIRMEAIDGHGVHSSVFRPPESIRFGLAFLPRCAIVNEITCRFAIVEEKFFRYFPLNVLADPSFNRNRVQIRVFNISPYFEYPDGQVLFLPDNMEFGIVMSLDEYITEATTK